MAIIGVNTTGRRESMTVQIAAASTALVLGEVKRVNGQWKRGALGENLHLTDSAVKKALATCGLVLDQLGRDALREVRDGAAVQRRYFLMTSSTVLFAHPTSVAIARIEIPPSYN